MYLDLRVLVQCTRVLHARDFCLHVNYQKTRVHGCTHVICVILNAGTVHASIKFKSNCTVHSRPFVFLEAGELELLAAPKC